VRRERRSGLATRSVGDGGDAGVGGVESGRQPGGVRTRGRRVPRGNRLRPRRRRTQRKNVPRQAARKRTIRW
jgi:hypothetical protein